MGREYFPFFVRKSRRQEERERQNYFAWAFPYGKEQQKKLRGILAELFPKEASEMAMMAYLTGREAYLDRFGDHEGEPGFDPVEAALQAIRGSSLRIPAQDTPLYVALIAADQEVDESLSYPSRAELQARAGRIRGR